MDLQFVAGALSIVIAYLVGSVNFAIIISRLWKKDDIRKYGSGNAGMTNMLRTYGVVPALLTLLGDFSKGIIAILLSRLVFFLILGGADYSVVAEYIVGLFAMVGHVYPIFYRFKGGKGVLVSAGVVLMLSPVAVLFAIGVFIVIVLISRIVSLGSIGACVCAPIAQYIWGNVTNDPNVVARTIMVAVFAIIIIGMHWQNIGRLIRGEENKFGMKKKDD